MGSKKVIVLGGDGFCGWPTALHLSATGYDVVIVDNLSRRKIDLDLGTNSLTPIKSMEIRTRRWEELTGEKISFYNFNVAENYHRLLSLFIQFKPDAVVHFAEQRAAPYSMRDSFCKRYTVDNNLRATHNVLCAIVESCIDVHFVHLGTMGVYGYETTGLTIPEGYLPVKVERDDGTVAHLEIIYPPGPGSIYHMTKTQDALFFYFYNKNDGLRITDLHQGIVWGTMTPETSRHDDLVNRFDYDGDYGTVLNRFLMQAAVSHPLTVHGTGGQTRAFIHIKDTVNCIRLAIENPPQHGDRVKIFNQATEVHTVRDLAKKVSRITGAQVKYFKNPRAEALENNLCVKREKFLALGLNPTTLDDGLMQEVYEIANRYKERCIMDKIICTSTWSKNIEVDREGQEAPVAH
ncbi:MAG TPA: NAD-dependent dehydratase [Desulfobulbaceae bacterium]|nr:NAD-dependent dehydratase [Desulfobulbaceae bacterium]